MYFKVFSLSIFKEEDLGGKVCKLIWESHLQFASSAHFKLSSCVRPKIRAFVPRRKNRATQ